MNTDFQSSSQELEYLGNLDNSEKELVISIDRYKSDPRLYLLKFLLQLVRDRRFEIENAKTTNQNNNEKTTNQKEL